MNKVQSKVERIESLKNLVYDVVIENLEMIDERSAKLDDEEIMILDD